MYVDSASKFKPPLLSPPFCFIDPIWKVARYTSAAPTYFSECDNYVDGGVLANNPCEAGLAHLQEFYHSQGTRLTISCMVSVGTGIYPKKELGSINGALGGVQSLFRLIDSAVSKLKEYNYYCFLVLMSLNKHFP